MIGNILYAQPGREHKNRHPSEDNSKHIQQMVDDLTKELDLSDEQSMNIKGIYEERFEKMKDKKDKNKPGKDKTKGFDKEGAKEMKELDEKIMLYLNDAQANKYKKLMENRQRPKDHTPMPELE